MDVTSADFEARVLERSREVPVLVDFWAPWCGPCRMLGPVLDKLAGEAGGRFELAKLNTDENPEVAARYQISGIPAVKLFRNAEVIAEFTGALPEREVRAFLDEHCPSEVDRAVGEAGDLLARGDAAAARQRLERALELDAGHPGAQLELARIALAEGDEEEVERRLAAIPKSAEEADAAEHIRGALGLAKACREAGGQEACRKRLAEDEGDLSARQALGSCLAAAGRHREALEELLTVVRDARGEQRDAARRAMVTVFGLLGRSPLASEYRRKLTIYL